MAPGRWDAMTRGQVSHSVPKAVSFNCLRHVVPFGREWLSWAGASPRRLHGRTLLSEIVRIRKVRCTSTWGDCRDAVKIAEPQAGYFDEIGHQAPGRQGSPARRAGTPRATDSPLHSAPADDEARRSRATQLLPRRTGLQSPANATTDESGPPSQSTLCTRRTRSGFRWTGPSRASCGYWTACGQAAWPAS